MTTKLFPQHPLGRVALETKHRSKAEGVLGHPLLRAPACGALTLSLALRSLDVPVAWQTLEAELDGRVDSMLAAVRKRKLLARQHFHGSFGSVQRALSVGAAVLVAIAMDDFPPAHWVLVTKALRVGSGQPWLELDNPWSTSDRVPYARLEALWRPTNHCLLIIERPAPQPWWRRWWQGAS